MDLINTTDIQANETNVNWYEDGEAANAAVLNRPTKQVAEKVNEVITKLQDNEVAVGLNAGETNQGTNAIAIGENAGQTDQPANTIAIGLNATPATEGDIVIQTTSNVIEVTADGMTVNGNRVGGGGSTLGTPVTINTTLEAGQGCLVDTGTAATEVVITLSAGPKAGEEHIVGDFSNFETSGSAYLYPIKIIPNPADPLTTIDGDTEFFIDKDGAKITLNFNENDNNWELSAGFNEGSSPKAIYNRYESNPPVGTSVFNVSYTVGYVDVLLNGIELDSSEFTATDGSTITLSKPTLSADDVVVIKAYILIDKIEDVTYTRKEWSGTALTGATSLPATGLENDVAKAYRLVIGGVLQQPSADYTISSATNEVILTEALDGEYDWYLLAEAQVQLFIGVDSQIDATNTNNTLTGTTVKDNIDELDAKVEALPEILGNPNLFINGDFSICQRGTGSSPLGSNYWIDRWLGNGGAGFQQRLVDGNNETYIQLGNSTNTYLSISQRVESRQIYKSTVTVSGQVLADADLLSTGIFYVGASYPIAENDFSSTETAVPAVTFESPESGVWTDFSLTVELDVAKAMLGLQVNVGFYNAPNADGYCQFRRMKLELGDIATPFVPDTPALNLMKCQRYFEAIGQRTHAYIYDNTVTYRIMDVRYKVTKRSVPLITINNASSWPASVVQIGTAGFHVSGTVPLASDGAYLDSWSADAEL